jgi:phage-related protein
MNWIEWQGKDNRLIKGLMIQKLPPITKPQLRTQITEIDGRDGDFVDVLGYATYDKTVTIGLFGSYDVDEIAKYFTGDGTLVLSSELDRVYNARCNGQIDFKSLIRFRTADVTFEVQPFKYLRGEDPVDAIIDTETEVIVRNEGLEQSKPAMRLEGSGIVTIAINGLDVFSINIDESYVIVDSQQEDAFITGKLKNSKMTGDFAKLDPGENVITWTGNLTRLIVTPRSRWL